MNAERLEQWLMEPAQQQEFLGRIRVQVSPEDYERIQLFCQLATTIGKDNLRKLRHLLFGRKTETTERVCPPENPSPSPQAPPPKDHPKRPGRAGPRRYTGARWLVVNPPSLKASLRL